MRIAVLVLMLVLLPLRGWAGGAMAVDHLPSPVQAMAQMESPCHEADPANPDDGSGHTCSLCDVCHSQLMGPAPAVRTAPQARATRHAPPAEHFASAPARQHVKPPRT